MATDLEQSFQRFRTTNWTLIGDLGSAEDERHREAMDLLVRSYWPPVYAYLRSRGRDRDSAAELTQAFFGDVIIGRDLFRRADPERGKLRSLMLKALTRFCIDLERPIAAQKRRVTMSLDQLDVEDARLRESTRPAEPEDAFDRRWALALFQEALRRAETHFRRSGKPGHWALFETRVLRPAVTSVDAPPLNAVAEKHGFASPALGAAAVQVVKRRVEAVLREVVAETLEEDADIDTEVAEVRRLLGGG